MLTRAVVPLLGRQLKSSKEIVRNTAKGYRDDMPPHAYPGAYFPFDFRLRYRFYFYNAMWCIIGTWLPFGQYHYVLWRTKREKEHKG